MMELNCPNCQTLLPPQAIEDGWCETCGKKIPDGLRRRAGTPKSATSGRQPSAEPVSRFYDLTPLASRTARLGAVLLDVLFQSLACAPGMILDYEAGRLNDSEMKRLGETLMLVGGGIMLVAQLALLLRRGQSLGKVITRVRIVCFEDESKIGLGTILLRELVLHIVGTLCLCGMIWKLVDSLYIFSKDRRCLHDHIAGTKVVVA